MAVGASQVRNDDDERSSPVASKLIIKSEPFANRACIYGGGDSRTACCLGWSSGATAAQDVAVCSCRDTAAPSPPPCSLGEVVTPEAKTVVAAAAFARAPGSHDCSELPAQLAP